MTSPPLVLIEWLDSAQPNPRWQHLQDAELPGACHCYTTGFLIKETDTEKHIALSIADPTDPDEAQIAGVMPIPNNAIISIEYLKSGLYGVLNDRNKLLSPANLVEGCDTKYLPSPRWDSETASRVTKPRITK